MGESLQYIHFGIVQSLIFYLFFGGDGPIKDAHDYKKKVELWESPQLIKFPLCSWYVPIKFPKFTMCSLRRSQ